MVRSELGDMVDERPPDVAAEHDRPGASFEDGRDERARGGLALGAGDADGAAREQPQEQVHLAHDRGQPFGLDGREGRPQSGLGRGEATVDRGFCNLPVVFDSCPE